MNSRRCAFSRTRCGPRRAPSGGSSRPRPPPEWPSACAPRGQRSRASIPQGLRAAKGYRIMARPSPHRLTRAELQLYWPWYSGARRRLRSGGGDPGWVGRRHRPFLNQQDGRHRIPPRRASRSHGGQRLIRAVHFATRCGSSRDRRCISGHGRRILISGRVGRACAHRPVSVRSGSASLPPGDRL